jgi:hypothetical protein
VARWTYLFADLLTDEPIEVLDVESERFGSQIVVPAPFSGTIPIPNPDVAELVAAVFPHPDLYPPPAGEGRVVCHVYRGDDLTDLWDSYLIWDCNRQGGEGGNRLDITGASLESYLAARQIWDDIDFVAEDQIDVAIALIADMSAELGGDIGLGLVGDPSGTLIDLSVLGSAGKSYGQALTEIANVDTGFEYRIRNYVDMPAGNRVREFVANAPGLEGNGVTAVASLPGNIVSYKYAGSALSAATRMRGRGDTVNDDISAASEPLMGHVISATDFLGAGWPYLDVTLDRQGVTDQDTLDSYARWWRDTRRGVVRIPELTVTFDDDTDLHPLMLGGLCNVAIEDLLFPLNADGSAGFRHSWRLIGLEITPNHRGDGRDLARIVLEESLS